MSPKEIAEKILNCKTYDIPDIQSLARAYLELEKKTSILKQDLDSEKRNHKIFREAAEGYLKKLKKSREGLRDAFEVIARGESQFDNVDHMYTAREALKADDNLMKEV